MNPPEKNDQSANIWISRLNLKAHPEGGFYAETYRSEDNCKLDRFHGDQRSCCTSIYYLLKYPESPKSRFHRIKADELWHYYSGLPLIIHILDEQASTYSQMILNNRLNDKLNGQPQLLVPHGKWFAAEIIIDENEKNQVDYTLSGCTCSPGFDFQDFEFATRSYLMEKFPSLESLITRLTFSD